MSMLSGSHRPKVDLIIENHAGTNSNSAIQLSAAVQDCNIYYFEEPNTPVFYNNKYVKDNVKMPLAHGERVFGRWEYIRYFMDNSIQVIQPDIAMPAESLKQKESAIWRIPLMWVFRFIHARPTC